MAAITPTPLTIENKEQMKTIYLEYHQNYIINLVANFYYNKNTPVV